jgi:hypothetical protein
MKKSSKTLDPTVFLSGSLVHRARNNQPPASYFSREDLLAIRGLPRVAPPSRLRCEDCTLARLVVPRRVPGGGGCRRSRLAHLGARAAACLHREEVEVAQQEVEDAVGPSRRTRRRLRCRSSAPHGGARNARRWRWRRTLQDRRGRHVATCIAGRLHRREVEEEDVERRHGLPLRRTRSAARTMAHG